MVDQGLIQDLVTVKIDHLFRLEEVECPTGRLIITVDPALCLDSRSLTLIFGYQIEVKTFKDMGGLTINPLK